MLAAGGVEDNWGLLFFLLAILCSCMVRIVTTRPEKIYIETIYDNSLQKSRDAIDRSMRNIAELGYKRAGEIDMAISREEFNRKLGILEEAPKPGAWALEDENDDAGPPYYVYRDESTGKSVTAVRGTKMYNEILQGMKGR